MNKVPLVISQFFLNSVLKLMICVFVGFSGSAVAQSAITFDAGQNFSTFKYTDSQGEIRDFSFKINGCYSLGYQYLSPNGLFIRAGIGMRRGGASLEYNKKTVEWDIHYADLHVGAGYLFNKWRVKPYAAVAPFFSYMIKGSQTLGQTTYDIKKDKTLSPTDFGVLVIPGIKVELSNTISFYVEYKQLFGIQNLETASGTDQKTYNRGFSFNLGVAVALIKYNYVTTQ